MLFDASLAELSRLKGAEYSFLKQLSVPEGKPTRAWLEGVGAAVGSPIAQRATDLLNSLDNRRFFQGFAEGFLSQLWDQVEKTYPG